jgi:hypothetical protein
MSLNNREFHIWQERGMGPHGGERGVGQQAGIFQVRLGSGEIEGRDRDTESYKT